MKKLAAALCFLCAASGNAGASTIDFNQYTSPDDNQLTSEFNQEPPGFGSPGPLYIQSQAGGVTGGAVQGYAGQNCFATATYNSRTFEFSSGKELNLGMDFYWNAITTPLGPGANAVRSFRLGLLNSPQSAFEMYGEPSAYIEGEYSFELGQMLLVVRSNTGTVLTSIVGAQSALMTDHWYRLDPAFINNDGNSIQFEGSFLDIGAQGTSLPNTVASWNESFQNEEMAAGEPVYAAFSALADGGISRGDNLVVPDPPVTTIPEPETWVMMLSGFGLFAMFRNGYPTRTTHRPA